MGVVEAKDARGVNVEPQFRKIPAKFCEESEHQEVKTANDVIVLDPEPWEKPFPFNAPVLLSDFPVDELPRHVRTAVLEVAKSRQVPVDLAAVIALGALSAGCARKYRVKIGRTHTVPLNLYLVAALPPGERKSDTYRDMTSVIWEIERELADAAMVHVCTMTERRKIEEARLETLRRDAARKTGPAARDVQAEAEKLAAELTEVPHVPRLIAQDVTSEKLGVLLGEQTGGSLCSIQTPAACSTCSLENTAQRAWAISTFG